MPVLRDEELGSISDSSHRIRDERAGYMQFLQAHGEIHFHPKRRRGHLFRTGPD